MGRGVGEDVVKGTEGKGVDVEVDASVCQEGFEAQCVRDVSVVVG